MPSIRLALLVLAAGAALAACGDSRKVDGEEGAGSECVACHGFPPNLTVTVFNGEMQHPQNTACYACHSATVDTSNALIEGGAHLNGTPGDIRILSGAACNQCHGMPPPPSHPGGTATSHPQNTDCWICHGTSVATGNALIDPAAGGTHYNGTIEVSGGHPAGYAAPAVHGPDANRNVVACQECHGADYAGGSSGRSCTACHQTAGFADWRTNCTFCHGTKTQGWSAAPQLALAAPPASVDGQQTLPTQAAVGAHQAHVQAGPLAAGFACSECHPPVAALEDATHLGEGPADIAFGPIATGPAAPVYTPGAAPTCASTHCHGNFTGGVAGPAPVWTETLALTCTSCHDSPATDTTPTNAFHRTHAIGAAPVNVVVPCATCHQGFTDATVNTATHVNGQIEAIVQPATGPAVRINGWDCGACHTALGI